MLTRRIFQGNTRSEISIYHGDRMEFKASYYIMRIARHSEASPSCFIVALIYLERFRKKRPLIALSSKTMQRLLLISSMIAFKYLEDAAIENARWYLQRCYTLFQSSPIWILDSLLLFILSRSHPRSQPLLLQIKIFPYACHPRNGAFAAYSPPDSNILIKASPTR